MFLMTKTDLKSPELYINRELSWLEFDHRVLLEGMNPDVPLLERLKFLAIVSSNLDEFFMIRVAGLKQQEAANASSTDPSGLTATGQLVCIGQRVRQLVAEHTNALGEVITQLAEHDIHLLSAAQWDEAQQRFLRDYFRQDVEPVITPIAIEEIEPKPLLAGLRLNVVLRLRDREDPGGEPRIAFVPVPRSLPRFIAIPAREGLHVARLEDVVASFADRLFPGHDVLDTAVFRLTRDNDVSVNDDEADDLLRTIEHAVRERMRRRVVRLEVSAGVDPVIRDYLSDIYEISEDDIYEIDGMLDAGDLMDVATRPGFDDLKYQDWPPQTPRDLLRSEDLYTTLQERDVLLFHPYERFDPVIELLQRAAEDPQVIAIKQTLYRTAGDSPIVKALIQAASSGKQVTVLVELKARFDEARNVGWARKLEDAGCDVIYGVAGLKTHAKLLLIVRREEYGIRRYVHLATGNYNDKTAKLYSDIGMMSSDRELANDASAFFNLLTGYSHEVGWSRLAIAPTGLRPRVLELIDREIQSSTEVQPGLIIAKINSLQDPAIIRALYRASQAGVQVKLNVRGICCLRPGVPDVSENIEVISIVDRYLEHARIFYFRNGGHEEIYMSSADWMVRNLDKRLETFFPVVSPELQARLQKILDTYFEDNVKAMRLLADGSWQAVESDDEPVRAQEVCWREAVAAVRADENTNPQYRPIRNPDRESR
jgi:polyphosphate kinase